MSRVKITCLCLALAFCAIKQAQAAQTKLPTDLAHKTSDISALSTSLQTLVRRTSAAVVQVTATGFSMAERGDGAGTQIFSRERGIGSGVLLSEDGMVMTNAHAVDGAHKIRVRLTGMRNKEEGAIRDLDAKLIGTDRFSDLALLKIDVKEAPYLTFADASELQQGELVLAFGSPLGLENSVSMGVVSSVARQVARDDPRVYIQTDAAINPGNSGGPLVDTSGRIVGINTFIMSQSGGSEGVGFAIPSDLVESAFVQLRSEGHVRRGQIGLFAKTITPALAEGLGMSRDSGVMIEDIMPGRAAERAGLKVGDILLTFAGKPINDVQQFARTLFQLHIGESVSIEVLRARDRVRTQVVVEQRRDDTQRFADRLTESSVVPKLGVVAMTVDKLTATTDMNLRVPSGVVVVARTSGSMYVGDSPEPGDVIHSLNNHPIGCLEELQSFLTTIKSEGPVVLQVERRGEMLFLVLEAS